MTPTEDVLGIPKFSLAERERRWANVRALMARDGIDAIFTPPNTGLFDMFQANSRYLSGMGGNHCMVAVMFPSEGDVTAISSPDVDKQIWMQRQDWVTDIRNIASNWGYTGSVVERLKELPGIRRLGVTGLSGNTRFPEGTTSHGIVQGLRELLPNVEIVNANALMEEARFVKSAEEIEFLRKSVELVERAVSVMEAECRPGVPENVVYAHMISAIIEGGGEIPSMILWSAGWPQPHSNSYLPTCRPLQKGDIVMPEVEARWGGYIGQNTQPLFIGRAPTEYHDMFALQQEALHVCYDMLRPGQRLGAIVQRINGMGNADFDCRILMHGRGLGDDSPLAVYGVRNETMANWMIEENSAFIIKPVVSQKNSHNRIYSGDTVVCTPNGARRLGKRSAGIIEVV